MRSSTREDGVVLPGRAGIALAVGPTGYGTAISPAIVQREWLNCSVAVLNYRVGAHYLEHRV